MRNAFTQIPSSNSIPGCLRKQLAKNMLLSDFFFILSPQWSLFFVPFGIIEINLTQSCKAEQRKHRA